MILINFLFDQMKIYGCIMSLFLGTSVPFFPHQFFIHYHSQTFTFCEHKNPHVLKITNHIIEDKSRGTNLANRDKTITYITTHTIYPFFFFLFFYLFLYVYIYSIYLYSNNTQYT